MLGSCSYWVGRLLVAGWLIVFFSWPAQAALQTFGPFKVDDTHPDIISLDGDIDGGAALNFRRAIVAAPNAKLVVLNSPGGLVQIALLIADDVHQRKLATYIPQKAGCYSACAYIFLAGIERQAEGELGVHQISSDSADLVSAQLSISDIIDLLNRFDTPVEVLTAMFKTPPKEMHVFTADEVARYRIDRRQEVSASAVAEDGGVQRSEQSDPASGMTEPSPTPEPSAVAALEGTSLSKLSAIEEYTRRPTRMAVFAGLDLFGDDITSVRVNDAASCARACLTMKGECKAFTFNTDPQAMRGPNCFLKASQGTADGNAVAISGQLLSGADPDPKPFSMGTIDPKTALFDNVDLPGGDLSMRPFGRNISAQQCRLACVGDNRCFAFTYLKRKKECWLKGAVGTPRYGEGMISGLKKVMTFEPASIISLE